MTMAIAASLQLSHELGICKRYGTHGYYSHHKRSMVRSVRLNLLSFTLSSHSMSQDFWSFHLSNTIYKPLPLVPSRLNVFMCRSFFIPDKAPETPILKASALALTRLCDAFHEGPVVLKLAPAVGIIAFAIWGLGPLMRHARKHFFRNDSNWKRSSTYYILTSYLQPLLLWTGAILICRVLDPVILLSEASQAIKQRLLNFVRSLSTVLAFAYCLSSLIQHAQKFSMETNDSSDTRNMGFQFVGKAVYSAVWVAAVSLFMELLGFSTHKWITAGGLGTVLLTLAGREILTNFLSSVMIHATQPFVVNEWIQTKIDGYEVSGTVEHVGWWSPTILRGDEREAIHVPNHKFTVNVVRNLSQKTHWRINTHLAISHLDANKINNIVADMRKLLAKNSQIEQQRLHRRVFLENINPENQALMILVSCFVKTTHSEEYLCVKEALLLDLLRIVSHHRARLATPIRTVQKVYADADIEDGPFPETIFTRARAATSHPFLLIESPSRINDDKMKAHSTNLSEEHDVNVVAVTGSKEKMSPSPDDSAQNSSDDKQPNKKNLGEAHPNSDKINGTSGTSAAPILPSKPQLEGLDSMGLNSKDITLLGAAFEKPPVSILDSSNESSDPASSAATPTYLKHGAEKLPIAPTSITRPTLEENIVLGVALEGSKRVLPIEEGIAPVPNPTESKELAACQKTNGSNIGKDEKESEMQAVPCAASSDQRDRER